MTRIGTQPLVGQGGLLSHQQGQQGVTLGQPSYSYQVAGYGMPPQEQQPKVTRPYADVGKLQMNLLGGGAGVLEPGQTPNETGGLITGLLSAVGGTFGDTGSQIGANIGRAIEVPVGLGGDVLGFFGSVPVPFGSEIAGGIGGALEAVGVTKHGQQEPTVLSDLLSPYHQNVTLGGVFQTALGSFGLLGRAIERTYAGSGLRGALPPDLEALVASGEISRNEAIDQAVARGQGFTNDVAHNMIWSILTDPLTWASFGVGGVAKAAGAGLKIERAAELSNLIAKGAEIAPDAARALRIANPDAIEAGLAAASLKKLGPLERLSLNTIGQMPGFNEVMVPVANQVIRLTDPLRIFSGGDIGRRTAEVVGTSATAGTMVGYKLPVVHRLGQVADAVVQGGRDVVNKSFAVLTTNLLYRYVADDIAAEYARMGRIPAALGDKGVAMNPTQAIRAVLEKNPEDASIGRDIEVMAEKIKPLGTEFATEAEMNTDTINRLAYAYRTSPEAVQATGMLKGGYDEWAASHAVAYTQGGIRLEEEVKPALRGMTLPEDIGDPGRYTMVAKDTLTNRRWDEIEKMMAGADPDMAGVRKAVKRYADFGWINEEQLSNADLLEVLRRWGNENASGLLSEIDIRDATGALRADLPEPLRKWLQEIDPLGYTLTNMPPEGRGMWRITRDAEGRILNINPFMEFQTEAQAFRDPNWFQRLMSQGLRQIRTERILWTTRRRFVHNLVRDSEMTPVAAERIYKAIMHDASAAGMTPRGLSPHQIMDAARRALKLEAQTGAKGLGTLSEVDLTRQLLVAFEGDLSLVGLTQKLTGRAKTVLPGNASNYWGRLSENMYPMIRFGLNGFFMAQELVEPYILNLMRGVPVPLNRHSARFEQAVELRNAMDKVARSDLTPDGVLMEMAEYQKILSTSIQQADDHLRQGRLGRALNTLSSVGWGRIQEGKMAAEGLLAMRLTGDLLKDAFDQMRGPEFWKQLEFMYGTTDTAVIANRWMRQAFKLAEDDELFTSMIDILKPEQIGAATRVFRGKGKGVRWHHISTLLGKTEDGADEELLRGLKLGISDAKHADAISHDDWLRMTGEVGIDQQFAERAYKMATGPEVKDFWDDWAKNMTPVHFTEADRKALTESTRSLVTIRARVMGLTEEEYVKTHMGSGPLRVTQKEAMSGANTLFQMTDNIARTIRQRHGIGPGVSFVNPAELRGAIRENREVFPKAGQGATDLNGLTDDISRDGFDHTTPIVLYYNPNFHSIHVEDGNHRMAAALRLNLPAVPVTVVVKPSAKIRAGSMRLSGSAITDLVPNSRFAPERLGFAQPRGYSHSLLDVTNEIVTDPELVKEMPDGFRTRIGDVLLPQANLDGIHQLTEELDRPAAAEHYFNYLAVNEPDTLRNLLPQMTGADARYTSNVLDRAKAIKERTRYVFRAADGKEYVLGGVEPMDLVNMAEDWMPPREGIAAANWYRGLREGVTRLFGASNADTVLRMFAVSQANDSPVNGMMMVLRALEQAFAEGFQKGSIREREFVTATARRLRDVSRPLGLQLNAENVVKAMLDLPIDRGYAAKLNDFADSLVGNNLRRWTGRAGNMPVAVDRHTARDVGFFDDKVISHLADSPYAKHLPNDVVVITDANGKHVMTTRKVTEFRTVTDKATGQPKLISEDHWYLSDEAGAYVGTDGALLPPGKKPVSAADLGTRPNDLQYEHGVSLINEATALFNQHAIWGKTNWRPEEVQAVGWMRVQKTLGGMQEDPLDTFGANMFPVAYEVSAEAGSPWGKAAPLFADLTDDQRRRIVENLDVEFSQWARETLGLNITGAGFVGPSRWKGGDRTFSAPGMLVGTPQSADDLADLRALVFRQQEVWAYHTSTVSRYVAPTVRNGRWGEGDHFAALDILIPTPTGSYADADRVLTRIADALDAPGATVFPDAEGNLVLRIIDRPWLDPTATDQVPEFFFPQHTDGGRYADGIEYRAGQADREAVQKMVDDALAKAGVDPAALGIESDLTHGTVYVAGPRRRPTAADVQAAYDSGDAALGQRLQKELTAATGTAESGGAIRAEGAAAQSPLMWETHLEDTLAKLRGRGRTVDEGALRDLQSQINQTLEGHLWAANPERYDGVARGDQLLFQRQHGTVLGFARRLDDGRSILGATRRADATTGLHELSHVFATDLDESQRALIQRTYASSIAAQRTDLAAHIADLEGKLSRARSPEVQRRLSGQITAFKHDLGVLVDEAQWGTVHEEWFADEFLRWLRAGKPPVRELTNPFKHFQNWLTEVWKTITKGRKRGAVPEAASPEMTTLFESLFSDRVPTTAFDADQAAMLLAGKQKIRQGLDEARTTQYFKRGRSFAERSINHPFVGMYPASYYWGKIVPEMFRFLALRPLGMKTPFLAWNTLREVSDTIRMQQTVDPSVKQWLHDNAEFLNVINMMFPAVPNDIPVNAPLWARRVSEQGLMNADRISAGLPTKPVDYMAGLQDSMEYIFGPLQTLKRGGELLGSSGEAGRGVIGNIAGALGMNPAPAVEEAAKTINPLTGLPFGL